MRITSRLILVLCLVLPLAISPWAFDDAYYLKETLLLVVGGTLLIRGAIGLWRGRFEGAVLPLPVVLFLVFAVASVWRVTNMWLFAFRLALLLSGLALFVVVSVSNRIAARRAQFLKALSLSALIATCFGFLQQLGLDPFLAPDPRFVSTFGNPQLYAEFVAPLLPAFLCLVLVAQEDRSKAGATAGIVIACMGLLWSRARGPALAGAAAMLFLVWVMSRTYPGLLWDRRKRIAICAGVLSVAAAVALLTGNLVVWKPWAVVAMPQRSRAAAIVPMKPARVGDLGVDFRLAVYRDTLGMIRESPLTGVGLGNFRIAYGRFAKAFWSSFPETGNEVVPVGHVHDDFLEVAAELGLPASVAFVWLILGFVRAGVVTARHVPLGEGWPKLAAAAGLIGLGLNSLYNFGFYDPATSLEFWVFAGMSVQPAAEGCLTVFQQSPWRIGNGPWRYWVAGFMGCVGLWAAWLGFSSELSDIFLDRGLADYYSARYAEAVETLRRAARLEVGRTEAKVMLAHAYLEQGKARQAMEVVREAQGLEPNNPQLFYLRGVVFARLGRLRESRQDQERALALYPLFALPRVAMGELAEQQGDLSGARAAYEEALRINPKRSDARDGLALLAVRAGNLDEAIRLWEEGARLEPGDAMTAHNLAVGYSRKGDSASAAYWQARAAALGAGAGRQQSQRP
jgi:tetratricopeptide (TPR) repeat protein